MYKALIVDDEQRILNGLKEFIQWEDYGIEIAGQASNSSEALQLMEHIDFSILITDINMPEMNGIELIRELKLRGYVVKTIILSGYDDFSYVKEAVKLGIENYLLKPVIQDELCSTLLNIVEKIQQETNHQIQVRSDVMILKNNILNRWLTGNINAANLMERAELLQIELNSAKYLVCLFKVLYSENHDSEYQNLINYASENICNEILSAHGNVITLCDMQGNLVAILNGNKDDLEPAYINQLLVECIQAIQRFLKFSVFATVGSYESDSQSVHKSYSNAKQLLGYSLIMPPNTIVEHELIIRDAMIKDEHVKIDYELFHNALALKNREQSIGFIDETFTTLSQTKRVTPLIVQNTSIEILYRILNTLNSLKIDTSTLLDNQDSMVVHLLKVKSLEELQDWLKSIVLKAIDLLQLDAENASPMIKRVLAFLDSSYADNISLKTIAASFNVNAAYLGQLFIKEKNEPFSSYINAKRIDKAKELLSHTTLELNEISEMVGYSNQSYFNSLFKKVTGVYPTKYRMNNS